jgi:type II secretory pathway pseudopilin PulG
MAEELAQFVTRAREKGNDDETIRTMLLSAGWPAAQVDAALHGLDVPLAPVATAPLPVAGTVATAPFASAAGGGEVNPATARPSIGALEAALQHILLWLFTGTVTTSIFTLVFTWLFGVMTLKLWFVHLVILTIAFAPFAVLYGKYLRERTVTPDLRTGKVWSIITIVIHSIGMLSALAGGIISLIVAQGQSRLALGLSFGLVLIVNGVVVAGYTAANFGPTEWRGRSLAIKLMPLILLVVVAGLLATSLFGVGAADKNQKTQTNLVNAAVAVRQYTVANKRLPATLSATDATDVDGITYRKLTSTTYELCGNFASDMSRNESGYSSGVSYTPTDSYVYKSQFTSKTKGKNCFKLRSGSLYYRSNTWYDTEEEPSTDDSADDSSFYEN